MDSEKSIRSRIPERKREVVRGLVSAGESYRKVAETLDISIGSVHKIMLEDPSKLDPVFEQIKNTFIQKATSKNMFRIRKGAKSRKARKLDENSRRHSGAMSRTVFILMTKHGAIAAPCSRKIFLEVACALPLGGLLSGQDK